MGDDQAENDTDNRHSNSSVSSRFKKYQMPRAMTRRATAKSHAVNSSKNSLHQSSKIVIDTKNLNRVDTGKSKLEHQETSKSKKSNLTRRSSNAHIAESDVIPQVDFDQEMTPDEKKKYERMVSRENRRKLLFYPEDRVINFWNLFITLLLMVVCVYTPIEIAFAGASPNSAEKKIDIFSVAIDMLFFIDMVILFNCAFYDMDYNIIEDRKEICIQYLKGWFTIDLLAIIPFDLLLSGGTQFNGLARIARFARLQKLVKLTRVLKIFKE
jgi:hypothetical protein